MASPELLKLALSTFATVFVAELGDKTQLATLALSGGQDSTSARLAVFAGSALALVAAAGLGVLAGGFVAKFASPQLLGRIGGVLFVAMGAWMLWQHRGA